MEELMYIDIFKNNGTEYLRLRESYRTKTPEGKVAIRKRMGNFRRWFYTSKR